MERITYGELRSKMFAHNRETKCGAEGEPISGVVVFKSSNWEKPFTETERSYRVTSACWGFMDGKISNAVYGDCLDGTDNGVRLDWYNWDVEYCYLD